MDISHEEYLQQDNYKLMAEVGVLKKRLEASLEAEEKVYDSLAWSTKMNAQLRKRVTVLEQALERALEEIEDAAIDGDEHAADTLMAGQKALAGIVKD